MSFQAAQGRAMLADYRRDQERRGLAKTTIRNSQIRILCFHRWLDERGINFDRVEAEDIQEFLDGRFIATRSRGQWLSTLGTYYKWAEATGRVSSNPVETIHRPRVRRSMPRPITDDDLAFAIQNATLQMRVWLTLCAYAGMRCVEISRLQVPDVDMDAGTLHLVGKGENERVVPMHPLVREALSAIKMPRRGPVFIRPMGGAFPAARVSRLINEYLHSIGVSATAHQLRHWFGTRTYEASRDIRVVQELLGHSSPTTTAVYTAYRKADARKAVDSLGDLTERG